MSTALTSLAILKVNYDHGRDFLDQFVPMVAHAAALTPGDFASVPDIQEYLDEEYSIRIPRFVIEKVLRRASKSGYVNVESGAYRVDYTRINDLKIDETRHRTTQQLEVLVDRLQTFVDEKFGISWTEDDAIGGLLTFVTEYHLRLLEADHDDVPAIRVPEPPEKSLVYVAAFITDVRESRPTLFEALMSVVKGQLLFNVVYFDDPNSVVGKFKKTEAYIDGPVLLAGLGYSGEEDQAAIEEMLDLLYAGGANVACFDHTVLEIQEILEACANTLLNEGRAAGFSPVLEHFVEKGEGYSDILLEGEKVRESLRRLRVEPKRPPSVPEDDPVDEAGLEEALAEEIFYRRDIARERDARSLAAVRRLRHGKSFSDLEHCRAVFVSDNRAVIRVSRRWFDAEEKRTGVPHAVTERRITTYIWLKNPVGQPELPEARVVADCSALLRPANELWEKYLDEIVKLREADTVSKDDYFLLRSRSAKRRLVELTGNDVRAFVEGRIPEILEHVRSQLVAEKDVELERERSRRKRAEQRWLGSSRRIRWQSIRAAKGISWLGLVGLLVGVAAGVIIGFIEVRDLLPGWVRAGAVLFQLIFVVGSIASLVMDGPLRRLRREVEVRLQRMIEGKLRAWFHGEGDE